MKKTILLFSLLAILLMASKEATSYDMEFVTDEYMEMNNHEHRRAFIGYENNEGEFIIKQNSEGSFTVIIEYL
jgi:hypothetical protein